MELKKSITIQDLVPPLATQRAFDAIQIKITTLKAHHSVTREFNAALIPATLKQLFAEAA